VYNGHIFGDTIHTALTILTLLVICFVKKIAPLLINVSCSDLTYNLGNLYRCSLFSVGLFDVYKSVWDDLVCFLLFQQKVLKLCDSSSFQVNIFTTEK
jgi:hypothetical protein